MRRLSTWWNREESRQLDYAMSIGWKSRTRAMLVFRTYWLTLVSFSVMMAYALLLTDIGMSDAGAQAIKVGLGVTVFALGVRVGIVLCEEHER